MMTEFSFLGEVSL